MFGTCALTCLTEIAQDLILVQDICPYLSRGNLLKKSSQAPRAGKCITLFCLDNCYSIRTQPKTTLRTDDYYFLRKLHKTGTELKLWIYCYILDCAMRQKGTISDNLLKYFMQTISNVIISSMCRLIYLIWFSSHSPSPVHSNVIYEFYSHPDEEILVGLTVW